MANLNGTWLGTYWQNGDPTRFEVVFIQSGNSLNGNILDDSHLGEAQLIGSVIGRHVSFVKQYYNSALPPIDYNGTVSEDENRIQGNWRITSNDVGTWEATRSIETLTQDLQNKIADTLLMTK
jgi:hypothetical protein